MLTNGQGDIISVRKKHRSGQCKTAHWANDHLNKTPNKKPTRNFNNAGAKQQRTMVEISYNTRPY